MPKLLHDHIRLQTEQKGLTGIELPLSGRSLQLFSAIENDLAGAGTVPVETALRLLENATQRRQLGLHR